MTFFCNSCEKEKDHDLLSILIIERWGHGIKRYCKECRYPKAGVADVFWDGKPEENLADDPHTGKPRTFLSKGQKAQYLKDRGLMEAGDRVHGAPLTFHDKKPPTVDSKHEVQMALKKVREMGAFRRKQEYLKIVKEAQDAQSRH